MKGEQKQFKLFITLDSLPSSQVEFKQSPAVPVMDDIMN